MTKDSKNRKKWTLLNFDPAAGQRPYLFKRCSISQLKPKLARKTFCMVVGEEGGTGRGPSPDCGPDELEEHLRNAPSWGCQWIK